MTTTTVTVQETRYEIRVPWLPLTASLQTFDTRQAAEHRLQVAREKGHALAAEWRIVRVDVRTETTRTTLPNTAEGTDAP